MGLERMILGNLFNQRYDNIHLLKSDYFLDEFNKKIFETALLTLNKTKSIDIVMFTDNYKKMYNQEFNYMDYNDIMDDGILYAGESHVKELVKKYEQHKLTQVLTDSIKKIKEVDPVDIASNIVACLEQTDTSHKTIQEVLEVYIEKLKTPIELKELQKRYYDIGVDFLNEYTAGVQDGEFTVIGARSGIGKTTFLLQNGKRWAEHMKVLMFSMEMTEESLVKRILVRETGIDNIKFKTRTLNANEMKQVEQISSILSDTSNLIIDSESKNINQIKRKILELKPDIVLIDYIQLMRSAETFPSREREVAELSRELKSISLSHNIPVVALTQLNDNAGDSRPTGERDIRESKAIYQNADNVIFIHRPNSKERENLIKCGIVSEEALDTMNIVEIILKKQRDGEEVKRVCRHVKSELRFQQLGG